MDVVGQCDATIESDGDLTVLCGDERQRGGLIHIHQGLGRHFLHNHFILTGGCGIPADLRLRHRHADDGSALGQSGHLTVLIDDSHSGIAGGVDKLVVLRLGARRTRGGFTDLQDQVRLFYL